MSDTTIDMKEILTTIPHRYPFLLIDRVVDIELGKRAVAIKNVTMNEHFFQGHFPGLPIMPGVLICEAIAQVGAVLALRSLALEGKIVYFAAMEKIRFRKPVVPGDQLRLEVTTIWLRGNIGKMRGQAFVEDTLVTEGEFTFSITDREPGGVIIHPTATVHASAKLGKGVEIGPYTVIGPEVSIGENTKIGPHCMVAKWTTIGKDNIISQGVNIASPPQDLKYKGEKSEVVIGDRNVIREFVTIHLPTGAGTKTIIGNDNLLMIHVHIPHNCKIGNQVILAGYAGLSGFSEVEDQAVVGGLAGIHQFVRLGRLSMIGGQAKIVQDIPPFMLVDGNPAQIRGINSIGMQRRGISTDAIAEVKKAFKIIYDSGNNTPQAAAEIKKRLRPLPEIEQIVQFLSAESRRGISKKTAIELEAEELLLPELPELGI